MRNKFFIIAWGLFILAFLGVVFLIPKKTSYIKEEILTFNEQNTKFQTSTLTLDTTQKEDIHIDLITELEEGKLEFELYDPKGFLKFEGYVERREDKLFKKLIYPKDFEILNLEVFTSEKSISEFLPISYFKADGSKGLIAGTYSLKVQPLNNAKGSITIKWSEKIDKKKFKEFKEKIGLKYFFN